MSRRQEIQIRSLRRKVSKFKIENRELTENLEKQRKEMEDLVARVPSSILNPRGDGWRIEQYNRNRSPEDQISSIGELDKKLEDLFENVLEKTKKEIKNK